MQQKCKVNNNKDDIEQLQKSYVCSRAWRAKFLQGQQLSKREKAMHMFYLYDNPDYRYLNPLT